LAGCGICLTLALSRSHISVAPDSIPDAIMPSRSSFEAKRDVAVTSVVSPWSFVLERLREPPWTRDLAELTPESVLIGGYYIVECKVCR
jgi:hypothetical protein